MNYVDLHTHSSCSDGTLTPSQLVEEASKCRLAAIALTDHDTVAGINEAIDAGSRYNVEVMSGVEISANYEKDPVHILGYGIDPQDSSLDELLIALQKARDVRNVKILEKLVTLGKPVDEKKLRESTKGLIGRPHIAKQMVSCNHVSSVDEAFRVYLKRGGKAFVAAERFPAKESVRVITKAGGLAVLAHPTTIGKNLKSIENLIEDLARDGLAGIEAIYPGHSNTICRGLIEIATKFELLYTGGSDFHGSVKSISLGGSPVMPPVPYKVYENLKTLLKKR